MYLYNILKQDSYKIQINYQIFDDLKIDRFKNDLSQNAVFKKTERLPGSSEIEIIYEIRRFIKNGYWRGILINVQESQNSYNVKIQFDRILP
jgi:hypothetical protein